MRLVGASFSGQKPEMHDFDSIIMDAVHQLNGEGLNRVEAEAQRDALIQGFRWILVDEYQDIGSEEYALISAVAGRSLEDSDLRLSLFAVGDDDQNIYAFAGASVQFIRKFEEDYRARPVFLTENYRSSRNIIEAANAVIQTAQGRMKLGHDISINRDRLMEPAGGDMAAHDPVAQGRVQLLDCPAGEITHGMAALDELIRISKLDPNFRWDRTAIIAREWKRLGPVRAYAEKLDIPVELANEEIPSIWRLREMQSLVTCLHEASDSLLAVQDIIALLNTQPMNRWVEIIAEGIAALARELGKGAMPPLDVIEWLAEWSRDTRGDQRGLLLLTGHRAKGLEFDHVVLLDGGWGAASRGEDDDAPRRLFYVGMTRAQRTLAVTTTGEHQFLKHKIDGVLHRRVNVNEDAGISTDKHYELPDLETVDLSFAGRLGQGHAAHNAIASTKVGEEIRLVQEGDRWLVHDIHGHPLGRMASAWQPPVGFRFSKGTVGAIVRWRKLDNDERYRDRIKRDVWETILPEFEFTGDRS